MCIYFYQISVIELQYDRSAPTSQDATSSDKTQWTKGMSSNGTPFEFGVRNFEAGKTEPEAHCHESEPTAKAISIADWGGPSRSLTYIHWPVDWARYWHAEPRTEVIGISQYQLRYDGGLIYDYQLIFTVTSGSYLYYMFEDEEGDTYEVNIWSLGDHFFRFNSKKPTIVKVTKTAAHGGPQY
ncbi:hypothetical protein H0H92_012383 [Tricholoma furcatifolium]|nr:hypothetical protein H0H92_012383 [Tricholoma furcatifolium]